jgi:TRAP-type transport system small permease protein
VRQSLSLGMNWLERILGAILIASIVLNFGNVVARYVFGTALISADELQVFALVAITFLGAAIVTWRGQHLRMDVIGSLMPRPLARGVRIAEAVVGLIVVGFICVQSWRYVVKVWNLDQVSDMAHVPMWIPHGSLLLGFVLTGLSLVAIAFGRSRIRPDDTSKTAATVGES